MELTYEEAQKMIWERIDEFPDVKSLVTSRTFDSQLGEVLKFYSIAPDLHPRIKYELLVVLSFYEPIGKLADHITESTDIPPSISTDIVTLIEATMLTPILEKLLEFDFAWHKANGSQSAEINKPQEAPALENIFIKETRSVSHATMPDSPQNRPPFVKKPLTREEVMNVLTPSRTMKSDVEALGAPIPLDTSTPSIQK